MDNKLADKNESDKKPSMQTFSQPPQMPQYNQYTLQDVQDGEELM